MRAGMASWFGIDGPLSAFLNRHTGWPRRYQRGYQVPGAGVERMAAVVARRASNWDGPDPIEYRFKSRQTARRNRRKHEKGKKTWHWGFATRYQPRGVTPERLLAPMRALYLKQGKLELGPDGAVRVPVKAEKAEAVG